MPRRTKIPVPGMDVRLARDKTRPLAIHAKNVAGTKYLKHLFKMQFGVKPDANELREWRLKPKHKGPSQKLSSTANPL